MGPTAVLLATLGAGLGALLLSPWARDLAVPKSGRLRGWVAVLVAMGCGAGAATLAGSFVELVTFTALATGAGLLVAIDLASERLPDVIVGPAYLIGVTGLTVAAATSDDWHRLGRAAVAAGIVVVVYFVLAFLSPANLGLGDVKLSGLLAAFLGWLGWPQLLLGALAPFILSGILAVILIATLGAGRRTAYPFGPLMIAGTAVGAAWGPLLAF